MMLLLVALAALSSAHFVLEIPTSVGFEDMKEGTPPCGGFDVTIRNTVTEWPIAGAPLKFISTHPRSEFTIQAALLPNSTSSSSSPEFLKLVPKLRQGGVGALCLTAVPGIAAWEGKDAVLQVIQVATDGQLFQCAAIKFVAGPPASAPPLCTNSSGITATFGPSGESSTTPASSGTKSPGTADKGGVGRIYFSISLLACSMSVPVLLLWL